MKKVIFILLVFALNGAIGTKLLTPWLRRLVTATIIAEVQRRLLLFVLTPFRLSPKVTVSNGK